MKTGMTQQVRVWTFRTCFVTPVFITNTLLGKVQPGKKLICPLKFICGHEFEWAVQFLAWLYFSQERIRDVDRRDKAISESPHSHLLCHACLHHKYAPGADDSQELISTESFGTSMSVVQPGKKLPTEIHSPKRDNGGCCCRKP